MLSSRRRLITRADCGPVIGRNLIRWSVVSMLPLVVCACTLFSDESPELPERLSKAAAEIEAEDAEFPNLASVPNQPPVVSGSEERQQIKEGLIADRAHAEYTTESLLPGGATANPESATTPGFYSIPAESGAESLASLEQETASAEPASRSDDAAPPPEPTSEPASDAMTDGSTPPEVEPMPEVAGIPPSPASEFLEPVAPPADSSEPAPPVADSAPSAAEPDQAPELAEPEAEVAALPPEEGPDAGTQILFGEGSADLSTAAQSELTAVADQLLQNENTRVQLLAYAGGEESASSQARRLSLSRAVAVRRFLIDQGVSSTRMDVRALGNQAEEEPADRVDIVVADR